MIVDIDLPLAVPQGDADAWATPAQGRSRFGFCNDPFVFTGYEGFSDAGFVAPNLAGNPHWTGVSFYAADSAAATPNVSANATYMSLPLTTIP
jgi:hypothetical protein